MAILRNLKEEYRFFTDSYDLKFTIMQRVQRHRTDFYKESKIEIFLDECKMLK